MLVGQQLREVTERTVLARAKPKWWRPRRSCNRAVMAIRKENAHHLVSPADNQEREHSASQRGLPSLLPPQSPPPALPPQPPHNPLTPFPHPPLLLTDHAPTPALLLPLPLPLPGPQPQMHPRTRPTKPPPPLIPNYKRHQLDSPPQQRQEDLLLERQAMRRSSLVDFRLVRRGIVRELPWESDAWFEEVDALE